MREIQVAKWCDAKHGDDRPYVHATQEVVVSFDRGKNQLLDLCEDHYHEIVVPLVTLVEEHGVNVDQVTGVRGGKVHNLPGPTKGQDSNKLPAPPCPECGVQPKTRGALGQHLKVHHGTGLSHYPEIRLANSPWPRNPKKARTDDQDHNQHDAQQTA